MMMVLLLVWHRATLQEVSKGSPHVSPRCSFYLHLFPYPLSSQNPLIIPPSPGNSAFFSWALEREDNTREEFSDISSIHKANLVLSTTVSKWAQRPSGAGHHNPDHSHTHSTVIFSLPPRLLRIYLWPTSRPGYPHHLPGFLPWLETCGFQLCQTHHLHSLVLLFYSCLKCSSLPLHSNSAQRSPPSGSLL